MRWRIGPSTLDSFEAKYVVAVVAVFGTTISHYLFFWQASQEVEEQRAAKGEEPLKDAPEQARVQLKRTQQDTYIGMGVSNVVAFFIMLTAQAMGPRVRTASSWELFLPIGLCARRGLSSNPRSGGVLSPVQDLGMSIAKSNLLAFDFVSTHTTSGDIK